MSATETTRPVLSDAQLGEMLSLMRGADSMELKLTIPELHQRSALKALGIDPLDAQIRQVYFFDTPDLALQRTGLAVRARRVQRKGDDTVVKLRPVVPGQLPEDLRESPDFNVEVDAMPGGFVCSGSFKGVVRQGGVAEAMAGDRPIRKLFSKAQRDFYAANAPEGVALDDLAILGPIFVLKAKWTPAGYDRKLVAEMWLYPDNSHILELSTRCTTDQAFQVAAEARAFLADRGVELSGEQQTKTKTALEFFTRELK
jgi:hypothetical protein